MLVVGLNAMQAALAFALSVSLPRSIENFVLILMVGLGGAGLIQLTYVVPLYVYLKKQGKLQKAEGVIIGACVIILINVTCWGLIGFR